MFSKLKSALGHLVSGGAPAEATAAAPPLEYEGYRITPAPFRTKDHYQTAGTIEKDTPEGVKKHAFIRADTYATWDDAVAFTTMKAKQIIDQQGDRIFDPRT